MLVRASGAVFEGYTATKEKVAIKKITLTAENAKPLITEIQILKSSKHKNIIEFKNSYFLDSQLWVCVYGAKQPL